jgi:hypothetical protein
MSLVANWWGAHAPFWRAARQPLFLQQIIPRVHGIALGVYMLCPGFGTKLTCATYGLGQQLGDGLNVTCCKLVGGACICLASRTSAARPPKKYCKGAWDSPRCVRVWDEARMCCMWFGATVRGWTGYHSLQVGGEHMHLFGEPHVSR